MQQIFIAQIFEFALPLYHNIWQLATKLRTCFLPPKLVVSSTSTQKNIYLGGKIHLLISLVFEFLKTLHIQGTLSTQPFKQRLILPEEMQKSLLRAFLRFS